MSQEPIIINRGRGPEIRGTRITVYDVMDYYRHGDHPSLIAYWLELQPEQVQAAIQYIEEHNQEVSLEYQRMIERDAQGNPPEIRAKSEESHRRLEEFLRNRGGGAKGEGVHAGNTR